MKKKSIVACLLLLLFFLLLLNLSFLRYFLPQTYPHRYCSDQCRFLTFEQAKGRDPLKNVELGFQQYKLDANKPDIVLYRRFYRKWWQAWNWYDFATSPRWSYPYAEKDEDT